MATLRKRSIIEARRSSGCAASFGMIKALNGRSFMRREYIAFDQTDSSGENWTDVTSYRPTGETANHLNPPPGPQLMTWKKRIRRGEKVGLELTKTERKLLLTGLVFLHERVEEAIK